MIERTLAIIKPDAWPKHGGAIIKMATEAGLVPAKVMVVVCMESDEHQRFGDATCACSVNAWRNFYYAHHDKPFFEPLVEFMASGPSLAVVLEGEDAIQRWRTLMGPTDSRKAPSGTIRGRFGAGGGRFVHSDGTIMAAWEEAGRLHVNYPMWCNAVHGSDSPEAAEREIKFFFGGVKR